MHMHMLFCAIQILIIIITASNEDKHQRKSCKQTGGDKHKHKEFAGDCKERLDISISTKKEYSLRNTAFRLLNPGLGNLSLN